MWSLAVGSWRAEEITHQRDHDLKISWGSPADRQIWVCCFVAWTQQNGILLLNSVAKTQISHLTGGSSISRQWPSKILWPESGPHALHITSKWSLSQFITCFIGLLQLNISLRPAVVINNKTHDISTTRKQARQKSQYVCFCWGSTPRRDNRQLILCAGGCVVHSDKELSA